MQLLLLLLSVSDGLRKRSSSDARNAGLDEATDDGLRRLASADLRLFSVARDFIMRLVLILALCQWFLTSFSERPGSILAIWVHLLPSSSCAELRMRSSSAVQATFFTRLGSMLLTKRVRTCSELRPGSLAAISGHESPCFSQSIMILSSAAVNGFLSVEGSIFFQRALHCG